MHDDWLKAIYNNSMETECLLSKRNGNFFPSCHTRESLAELETACVSTAFLILQNFHLCYHNFMETGGEF